MKTESPQLEQAQLLDAVPARNAAVRVEERGSALVLWVPIKRRWWTGLIGSLLPLRDERGIELDDLGQQVWKLCDGERSLEAVIEAFAEAHQLRFHEARISVMTFVRSLCKRNLMAIVVDQPATTDREEG